MDRVKLFFEDLSLNSKYEFLEWGKNDNELKEIAIKRGIQIPSKDLAIFKGRYAMVDKENKNKCTLPRKEVKKALKTLNGKAIDKDHLRENTIGFWLDAELEEDEIISYGAFWKSNFPIDYEEVKKRMAEGKMKISFEAWGDREFKENGSYDLTNIEFAGGALLFETNPAFPEAEILEMSNKVLEFAKVIEDNDEEEGRIDITENYIRIRQKDPSKFEQDSFRTIVLSKSKGIKAIIGRLKGETKTTVQSYLFDKDKFSESEAKKWVEEHKGSDIVEEMEDAKFNFIPQDCMIIDKFLWDTPCPSCQVKGMYKVSLIDFDKSETKVNCGKCGAKYTLNLEPDVELNKKGKKIKSLIQANEENISKEGGIKEVDELLKKYNKTTMEEVVSFLEKEIETAKTLAKEIEDGFLKVIEEAAESMKMCINTKIKDGMPSKEAFKECLKTMKSSLDEEIATLKGKLQIFEDEKAAQEKAKTDALIKSRKDELGEFAKDIKDEDIVNDIIYENAKLKKENDELKKIKVAQGNAGLEAGAHNLDPKDPVFVKQDKIKKKAFN